MKYTVLAAAVAAMSMMVAPVAMAEVKVSTKGGFQIKDDDFEAKIGGRIHFDGIYFIEEDDIASTDKTNSSTSFRRARLTLEGRAYDWTYKVENDFAGQTDQVTCAKQDIKVPEPTGNATDVTVSKPAQTCSGNAGSGFREVWIGTKALGHNIRIGQAKPYRGMEELTSSNEITFMERPFATASGIYHQFQQGIFVDNAGDLGADGLMAYGYGAAVYNTRDNQQNATQGVGYNLRGYLVPLRMDNQLIHIGVSGSADQDPVNDAGSLSNGSLTARPRLVGRDGGLRTTIVGQAEQRDTYALELAYQMGAFQTQAEYATSDFDVYAAAGNDSQKVDTAYIQASYFVTGHMRPYDFKKGVFKSPKVESGAGAIELKARYDMIENKDTNAEGTQYMVGMNYYVNPNVRLMLEYVDGTATSTKGVETDASAIQTRLQFGF
jgi:phosphate-selective porin OprO/OprP